MTNSDSPPLPLEQALGPGRQKAAAFLRGLAPSACVVVLIHPLIGQSSGAPACRSSP